MIPTHDEIAAFYSEYRLPMAKYATRWVRDFPEAEGVVDKVFLAILERPRDIKLTLRRYVYKSVKRECINKIRKYALWKNCQLNTELSTFATITSVDNRILAATVILRAKEILKPRSYQLLIEWMERPKQDDLNALTKHERVLLHRAKQTLRKEFS